MKGPTVTRLRSNHRDLTGWLIAAGAFLAVYLLGCHFAHAGVGPTDHGSLAPGIDWTFWIALVSLVLGLASHVLHFMAPRTKTTVDDEWRDRVDAMLGWWNAAAPKPTPRDPQAGKSFLVGMLGIALGCTVLIAVIACTATQARQTAAAGIVAALDCEAQHLTGEALGDLRGLAEHTVQGWISGSQATDLGTLRAKVKADLALFKTDAGRCAIAGALAAIGSVVSRPGEAVSGLFSAAPDPTMTRAAFALEARAAAWPALQVAGGTI